MTNPKGFGRAQPLRNFVCTWRADDGNYSVGVVEAFGLRDAVDVAFKHGQTNGLLLTRAVDPVSKETVVLAES